MKPRDRLWDGVTTYYGGDTKAAQAVVLDQYKLYVEMVDRISQRRGLTNTFFLTINTAVFTLIGIFLNRKPASQPWWLLVPLIPLLGQCFAWYCIVRYYRNINRAKFQVIYALEERLPASPWNAEWEALGKGKAPIKYWPLSHVEQLIPILLAASYIGGFVAAVIIA